MPPKRSPLPLSPPTPQHLSDTANASPTSSKTLSEASPSPSKRKREFDDDEEMALLARYQQEMEQATNCAFDLELDDGDISWHAEEYEEYQKKRIKKYSRRVSPKEGIEQDDDGDDEDLPLIELWLAKAKATGFDPPETKIEKSIGTAGVLQGNEEEQGAEYDESVKHEGTNGNGDGDEDKNANKDEAHVSPDCVPRTRVLEVDSLEAYVYMYEREESACELPLPDEDDADL